jgi:hypothetical protein
VRFLSLAGGFAEAGDGTRTRDPLFTRQALYQLSYSGTMPECTGRSRRRWRRWGRRLVGVFPWWRDPLLTDSLAALDLRVPRGAA